MTLQTENDLDELDWRILAELQNNARLSFSEIARRVNSTQPTVTERVRRLESSGSIAGYRAEVVRERVGWPIMAFVRLDIQRYIANQADNAIQAIKEISECHRITGDDCFLLKVHATSIEHLDSVIAKLGRYGAPATSIVLASIAMNQAVQNPMFDTPASVKPSS